jgi:hypothetical protein
MNKIYKRGFNCVKSGIAYEKIIHNIVKKCKINNKLFNTQKEKELGGCNANNDIECNFRGKKNIGIEIKKCKTPDWMQCCLKYHFVKNKWIGSPKNKIPTKSKKIFEKLLGNINLFNGKIPPFVSKNITYDEWTQIKKDTSDFNDIYLECPNNKIQKLYKEKGCKYIQISEKGLYHLGTDICNFKVPKFICPQELRIRTKVHKTNRKGFCRLSVIISCKPKNINSLLSSPYSLDDTRNLPTCIIYNNDLK